jgi:hypothetical protein
LIFENARDADFPGMRIDTARFARSFNVAPGAGFAGNSAG